MVEKAVGVLAAEQANPEPKKAKAMKLVKALSALCVFVAANSVALGVYVPANSAWSYQSSETFEVGTMIHLTATGTWTSGSFTGGAAGDGTPPGGSFIMPDANAYSLIGRIGNGTPFYVGPEYYGPANASGVLYLGMNDVPGVFGDNSGGLTVVPEPSALALVCLGGLALLRRRQ